MKIGCCGFPIRRERYFREFDAVEVQDTFFRLPRLSTVQRWRAEAPRRFEFVLKASQLVTHPSASPSYAKLGKSVSKKKYPFYGLFRPTDEVFEAWSATAAAAKTLAAGSVLFQTPPAFYPHPDRLRDMYAFFRKAPRRGLRFFWEPRGAWPEAALARIRADLDLRTVGDPLRRGPAAGKYWRLNGAYHGRRVDYGHVFTDGELAAVADLVGRRPAYVFFNNRSMWNDARRLRGRLERAAVR